MHGLDWSRIRCFRCAGIAVVQEQQGLGACSVLMQHLQSNRPAGRPVLCSSAGEASAPEDVLWLMARAGYKPVIDSCGGKCTCCCSMLCDACSC